jgi:hypothetical protein
MLRKAEGFIRKNGHSNVVFQDWYDRVELPEADRRQFEEKLLGASARIHRYLHVAREESGRLHSFPGESVFLQAAKL